MASDATGSRTGNGMIVAPRGSDFAGSGEVAIEVVTLCTPLLTIRHLMKIKPQKKTNRRDGIIFCPILLKNNAIAAER